MSTDVMGQLEQINRNLQLLNRHVKLMNQMNRAFMKGIKLWSWENFIRSEKARDVAAELKESIDAARLFYYDCMEENSEQSRQLATSFLLLLTQQNELYNSRFSWHSR